MATSLRSHWNDYYRFLWITAAAPATTTTTTTTNTSTTTTTTTSITTPLNRACPSGSLEFFQVYRYTWGRVERKLSLATWHIIRIQGWMIS